MTLNGVWGAFVFLAGMALTPQAVSEDVRAHGRDASNGSSKKREQKTRFVAAQSALYNNRFDEAFQLLEPLAKEGHPGRNNHCEVDACICVQECRNAAATVLQ
jgi:hypothetical protein